MTNKKSAAKLKVKKPERKEPTKQEFFDGKTKDGKPLYDGDCRQYSIKEMYLKLIDKDVEDLYKSSFFIQAWQFCKDIVEEGCIVTWNEVFAIRDDLALVLNKCIKDKLNKLTLKDFELEREVLPNGKQSPKLKNPLLVFYDRIETNDKLIDVAVKAFAENYVSKYKSMLTEDAWRISALHD